MKILRKVRIWARRVWVQIFRVLIFATNPGGRSIDEVHRQFWREMMRIDAEREATNREHRERQLGLDESRRAFNIAMDRARKRVDALMKFLEEEP